MIRYIVKLPLIVDFVYRHKYSKKLFFFKHIQIKILRTLKWCEYYGNFRSSKFRTPAVQSPLNTDWPFCRESRVIIRAHRTFLGKRRRVHICIKTAP